MPETLLQLDPMVQSVPKRQAMGTQSFPKVLSVHLWTLVPPMELLTMELLG